MSDAISTHNLTKMYGSDRGVDTLNLQIHTGEVFGYLGPNGAGKTTTIRMLLDFIRPTSGRAEVLGMDAQKQSMEIRRQVSYLPGELTMYDKMTGAQLLHYFSNLRGSIDQKYVDYLVKALDLDLSRPIRSLSKGNKQKIGMVQAFMHKPKLLILDEPTSGLDPLVQQTFYELVREVQREGRTVFLSSHLLAEVEAICDRVGIIRKGELIRVDDVKVLKHSAVHSFEVTFTQAIHVHEFEHIGGVNEVSVTENVLKCTVEGSVDAFIKAIARYEVLNLVSNEGDLEDIFLTFYNDKEATHVG